MVDEKRIEAMSRELADVRSRMEELGPIAVGTLARSSKKYRTKDGREHVCADSAVLKFAGSRGMRMETLLTRFGKVRVARRYVVGNKDRPGFAGRVGRCTKSCEEVVAEEGCGCGFLAETAQGLGVRQWAIVK